MYLGCPGQGIMASVGDDSACHWEHALAISRFTSGIMLGIVGMQEAPEQIARYVGQFYPQV